jgi:repressor LexA
MSVGKQIKKAREAAGLTQKELGRRLGVTSSAVANYENGISHPREDIFVGLIKVLGVDANYFYFESLSSALEKEPVFYSENEKLQKYIALDAHGRIVVDCVLDLEYERVRAESSNTGEDGAK